MIDIQALNDLHFAYELDNAGESFEEWQSKLAGPEWARYGVLKDGELCGVLGMEKIDDSTCGIHLSTRRGSLTAIEATRTVVQLGIILFKAGFQRLRTNGKTRVGRILALRSGMTRMSGPLFQLTAEEYFADPQRWESI